MKKQITNRIIKKHNRNLANAALSDFLGMIKYKGEWYNVDIIPLNQFDPSTTVCSNCGYKNSKIPTHIREWTCPQCNVHHDRDINAAIVIEQKAREYKNV